MVNMKNKNCKKFNVLFTCIGRRVSLLRSFKKAAKELKLDCHFLGTEKNELSPAFQLCDKKFSAKPIDDANYLKQLFNIIKQNNVKLLIPTIDTDLRLLAKNKKMFNSIGCSVLVSSPDVVDICNDKRKTFKFLIENGFDTPLTFKPEEALAKKNLKYPLILKPWDGSASKGVVIAQNRKELAFYLKQNPSRIVQEFIRGKEFTCGIYIDFNHKVRCVVPRERLEVRAGEVSKGKTVKNYKIMRQVAQMLEKLGAGPGVITVQLMLTKDNKVKFIEINPRFGGGTPLSIKAGANFPKWILQEVSGKKPNIKFDGFENNLIMLRYDAAVWLKDGKVLSRGEDK